MNRPSDKEMEIFDGYVMAALTGLVVRSCEDPASSMILSKMGGFDGVGCQADKLMEAAMGYGVGMMRKRQEMLERMGRRVSSAGER